MAKTKIHQVVLKMSDLQPSPEHIVFNNPREFEYEKIESHWLPSKNWTALGSPDEITVHVFPGDVSHHFPVPKNG